jgi:predicted transposase/invertase (TIGR01784 family)
MVFYFSKVMRTSWKKRFAFQNRLCQINTLITDAKTQGKAIGKTEGIAIGKKEGKRESALLMLTDGLPVTTISRYTGLSESEILELKKT